MYTEIIAFILFITLVFYCLSGGPDYGAGFWYLLTVGQHKKEERYIISKAIEPIWETNHVWLIIAIVILFTAYPAVFSSLCTELNVPFSLMLIGIVLRGSAFVFRHYYQSELISTWDVIFVGASIITPILLGMIAGAITSANLGNEINSSSSWSSLIAPWTTPYCILSGLFALNLFAFLASVYLTVDASGRLTSQKYFRSCAIIANCSLILLLGGLCFYSKFNAYSLWNIFYKHQLSWMFILSFFISAFIVFFSLKRNSYSIARVAAMAEMITILAGIAVAQFPFLVPTNMSIYNCAANITTLELLIAALISGAIILFPSLYILFKIFKGSAHDSILAEH